MSVNRVLSICMALFLSACGGSGSSHEDSHQSNEITISGAGVKGPLANAVATLYQIDYSQEDFKGSQVTLGTTNNRASIEGLSVNDNVSPPYLLEITSVENQTIDLSTGAYPVIESLSTVITQDMLNDGISVYATPVTTMAVRMLPALTDDQTLSSELESARARIMTIFGLGLNSDLDIFSVPPLVTNLTEDEASLEAVLEYRTIIESLTALTYEISEAVGNASPDEVLEDLADDAADGVLDGNIEDDSIDSIALAILAQDPSTLVIPNDPISRTVADVKSVLVEELNETEVEANVDALMPTGSINITSRIDGYDVDLDGDGVGNKTDTDDDNDGVPDTSDAFPFDETESVDSDADGLGNNADPDDDNDGVADTSDAFPFDETESVDSDADGVGNNTDPDDDNDGVEDDSDDFPFNDAESLDTDGDGIGNNYDTDDDDDGLPDEFEISNGLNPIDPLDAQTDRDSDGYDEREEFLAVTDPMDSLSSPDDSRIQRVLAQNGQSFEYFGYSVSMKGDTAIVGVPGAATAYIYEKVNDSWIRETSLTIDTVTVDDGFGSSVAIDHDVAVIGAPNKNGNFSSTGAAYIFVRNVLGNWQLRSTQKPDIETKQNIYFGYSVSIDDDKVIVGSPSEQDSEGGIESGAAYIYERNHVDDSWTRLARLLPNTLNDKGRFGASVDISNFGNAQTQAVVGAPGANGGSAYIFIKDEPWFQWRQFDADFIDDSFGSVVVIHGDTVLVSDPSNSIVKLFVAGVESNVLVGANNFGHSLAIDNNAIAVATSTDVQIFDVDGVFQSSKVIDDETGVSDIAIDGNNLLIGDSASDLNNIDAGVMYFHSELLLDSDEDGIANVIDNCPNDSNPDQENGNGGNTGNACDGYSSVQVATNWTKNQVDDYFGSSLSVGEYLGQFAVVGSWGTSSVSFYLEENDVWTERNTISGSEGFGVTVKACFEYALVRLPGNSGVGMYQFNEASNLFEQVYTFLPETELASDRFGESLACSDNAILIGAPGDNGRAGAVYAYYISEITDLPEFIEKIVPPEDIGVQEFGRSIDAHGSFGSGEYLIIGAPYANNYAGAAYIYEASFTQDEDGWDIIDTFNLNDWQSERLSSWVKSGDYFGYSVAVFDRNFLVGAPRTDINGEYISGAAYYLPFDENWERILPDKVSGGDQFGWEVNLGRDYFAISAIGDDENADDSGATYLFNIDMEQVDKLIAPAEESNESDYFGAALDFNEDGAVPELLIGIDTEDGFNEGRVYRYVLP